MKHLKIPVLVGTGIACGAGLLRSWEREKIYPSTDDALLRINVLGVVPQVGRRIAALPIVESDDVSAGATLFQLDEAGLEASRNAAQNPLDIAIRNAGMSADAIAREEAQSSASMRFASMRTPISTVKGAVNAGQMIGRPRLWRGGLCTSSGPVAAISLVRAMPSRNSRRSRSALPVVAFRLICGLCPIFVPRFLRRAGRDSGAR